MVPSGGPASRLETEALKLSEVHNMMDEVKSCFGCRAHISASFFAFVSCQCQACLTFKSKVSKRFFSNNSHKTREEKRRASNPKGHLRIGTQLSTLFFFYCLSLIL